MAGASLKSDDRIALWRSLFSALAGFIAFGAWAWFVNREYGPEVGVKAWWTQGSYSFVLTLIMTLIMEAVFKRSKSVVKTAVPVCLGVYATSWSVNWLAGTPDILQTIAPGAVISTVYTVTYCLGLRKLALARSNSPDPV